MEDFLENADGFICSECGTDVSESDKICPKCGADLSELIEPDAEDSASETAEVIIKEKQSSSRAQVHTFSSDEKVIAKLGQKFVSLLVGGGLTNTSLLLTNKRLYASGLNYSARGKSYQSRVGEIRSLHTIGLMYQSNFWLLVIGIPLLVLYGAGLIFIGLYFWTRHRYIQINFGGDLTSLSLRGVSNDEVESFIKKVMLEKEKVI